MRTDNTYDKARKRVKKIKDLYSHILVCNRIETFAAQQNLLNYKLDVVEYYLFHWKGVFQ